MEGNEAIHSFNEQKIFITCNCVPDIAVWVWNTFVPNMNNPKPIDLSF